MARRQPAGTASSATTMTDTLVDDDDDDKAPASSQRHPDARTLDALVPGLCDGALPFLTLAALWTLWTLVLPLALLLPLSYQYHDDGTVWGVRAAMVAMIVTGVVYLAYQLSPLVFGPHTRYTAPPAHGPLASTTTEPRPAYQITVKRVVAIVNPYGGGGRNRRRWEREALPMFRASNVTVDIHYTNHSNHANELCRTLSLTGYDCLVVVGGDGTFHECVNGLLTRGDKKMLPMALVPGGTGNAFATDLGSLDWKVCVDRVIDGTVCYIDVNHVTTTNKHCRYPLNLYSIEVICWGLVGDVAVQSEARWMRVFGLKRYDLCGVWGILKGFRQRLRIQVYDSYDRERIVVETSNECVTAYINNTQYFAKLLRAAPSAVLDDGKFDLLFLEQASRVEMLSLFTIIGRGSHTQAPSVKYHQASKVRLTPLTRDDDSGGASVGVLNIDGENFPYEGTIQVECLHKRLPILADSSWRGRAVPGLKEV